MHLVSRLKIVHRLCFSFPLGTAVVPREIEDNGHAKFLAGGKQGALWEMSKWRMEERVSIIYLYLKCQNWTF